MELKRSVAVMAVVVGAWATATEVAHATEPPVRIDDGALTSKAGADGGFLPRFEFLPYRWKSHTLTYYNGARKFTAAIKKAAAAWNRSGVKATWKPASRGTADVIIKITPNLPAAGLATADGRHGLIELHPTMTGAAGNSPQANAMEDAIVAHEMGHVMGLDHEDGTCATMNSSLWSHCKDPKQAWQYRCRILQPDDVRGGIALFGGRANKLGREFCAFEKAPAKVTNLKAEYRAASGTVALSWSLPKKNRPALVSVYRGKEGGGCPKPKGGGISGGKTGTTDTGLKVGTYCYVVRGESKHGRPGGSASVKVEVTGLPPTAVFYWSQVEATVVEFFDDSYDDDDAIVSWRWDFGDETTSAEPNPVHTYPGPGTYTVTLTVSDAAGNTGQYSESIYVEEFF